MKKVKFPELENPILIANYGFLSQWCCKCGNRHIWHFKIHKGDKSTGGAFIEINFFQDDKGAELRDYYDKTKNGQNKNIKTKTK